MKVLRLAVLVAILPVSTLAHADDGSSLRMRQPTEILFGASVWTVHSSVLPLAHFTVAHNVTSRAALELSLQSVLLVNSVTGGVRYYLSDASTAAYLVGRAGVLTVAGPESDGTAAPIAGGSLGLEVATTSGLRVDLEVGGDVVLPGRGALLTVSAVAGWGL